MNYLHEMHRLQESCKEKGPLCIGLDTDPSYIPESILSDYAHPAEAVLAYNKALIDATKDDAGCYKVQIAYYEAMGLKGLSCYLETLRYLRSLDIPFIADIKRGDIADTAKAYARAHFSGDFEANTITVNPYMGFDTLEPFLEWCKPKTNNANPDAREKTAPTDKSAPLPKGFFVLLRTSNPGMVDIEKQELASGGFVLDRVGEKLLSIEKEMASLYANAGLSKTASDNTSPCSPVGAVVGCTEESDARALRDAYPNIFFLIPGYGAQGGAARIAATLLDKAGGTVNSSRGILTAWKNDSLLEEKRSAEKLCLKDIVESAQRAAKNAKEDLLSAKNSLQIHN
ncbi:MAG: orotidine-5'-phosphate decarboxylase [Treponema sp.]|jgi:orotidine-5'-phosphate decarboxylase|nr:orotidine-5'-phosphate decarboxylase [Treponema sp.]